MKILLITLFFAALYSQDVTAQVDIIWSSDYVKEDRFGRAVDHNSDTAIVCAPTDDNENGIDAGAAYVFRKEGSSWLEVQKLIPTDGQPDEWFCVDVALDGNYAVIGSFDSGTEFRAGAAYVFEYDGNEWQEVQKLIPERPEQAGFFGRSVAISGSHIVVGAEGHQMAPPGRFPSGAVFLYTHDGSLWTKSSEAYGLSEHKMCAYGQSVSISGLHVAVGSSVFTFDCKSAIETFTIEGDQLILNSFIEDIWGTQSGFGGSVAVDGTRMIVGAPKIGANATAAVYSFSFNGASWDMDQKIEPNSDSITSSFGVSVALYDRYILISSRAESPEVVYAHRFFGGEWVERALVLEHLGDKFMSFGGDLSLFSTTAMITSSNGVYIIELPPLATNTANGSTHSEIIIEDLFPNPTRHSITLSLSSANPSPATVSIYDVLGREVATVNVADPTKTSVVVDLRALPPGAYFARVTKEGRVDIRPFVVVQ